jgi:hypothetical protein
MSNGDGLSLAYVPDISFAVKDPAEIEAAVITLYEAAYKTSITIGSCGNARPGTR